MTKEILKLALEALEDLGMKHYESTGEVLYKETFTAIKEALAQQDSKDKEQAKTDSFVRQLDEALAQPEPWEKFCDSNCVWTDHHPDCKLAQPEPVAWLHRFIEGGISIGLKPADLERHPERWEPLYTSPPQRKPLTDEEIDKAWRSCDYTVPWEQHRIDIARAIEAAHGIKE